jgi:hypothetical protein
MHSAKAEQLLDACEKMEARLEAVEAPREPPPMPSLEDRVNSAIDALVKRMDRYVAQREQDCK